MVMPVHVAILNMRLIQISLVDSTVAVSKERKRVDQLCVLLHVQRRTTWNQTSRQQQGLQAAVAKLLPHRCYTSVR
jgi:hypothetical protein